MAPYLDGIGEDGQPLDPATAKYEREHASEGRRMLYISFVALALVFVFAAIIIGLVTSDGGAQKDRIERVTPLTIQVAPAAQAANTLVLRLP